MKRKATNIDIDYLRRCKASTPTQRLEWLEAAQEFARAVPGKKKRKLARL